MDILNCYIVGKLLTRGHGHRVLVLWSSIILLCGLTVDSSNIAMDHGECCSVGLLLIAQTLQWIMGNAVLGGCFDPRTKL
jgi:hypothetical protein